jgi:hypothetical protein
MYLTSNHININNGTNIAPHHIHNNQLIIHTSKTIIEINISLFSNLNSFFFLQNKSIIIEKTKNIANNIFTI